MTTYLNDVTPGQVLDTLRDVVRGQEDYVYGAPAHQAAPGMACFYVHTDQESGEKSPGCVVGHVLNRLGVPLDILSSEYEGMRAAIVVVNLTGQVDPDSTTVSLGRILDQAQQVQDNNGTWGEALRRAESVYASA